MLNQFIWWGGIALELLLLVRGIRGKLVFQYPVFYAYISFVLLQSLLRLATYHWNSSAYPYVYWVTEFVGVAIGCGVVFEIYRVGLSAFPGTARVARNLLFFVFVMAIAKTFVDVSNDPRWRPAATTMDLERILRIEQAFAIVALIALFLVYSIPFGRNLRGILLGYGMFIAMSVIWLTFGTSSGDTFRHYWSYAQPPSYFMTLAVWAAHLWSYRASPEPRATVLLEQQYQRIAAATTRRLQDARGYLARAVRP